MERPPGRRAVALVLGLALFVTTAAAQAPGPPELLVLDTSEGHPLHVLTYRPSQPRSQGAVLAPEESHTDRGCWEGFARELCAAGWLVWVPDLVAWRQTYAPGLWVGAPDASWGATELARTLSEGLGDSIRTLVVLCLGERGPLGPVLAELDPRVGAIAWIAPGGAGAGLESWERLRERPVELLFAASQAMVESSALASDAFSRFNGRAQLRLFSRGKSACALLETPHIRRGLREWLVSTSSATPQGSVSASAETTEREPGR